MKKVITIFELILFFITGRLMYQGFWLMMVDYGSGDVNQSFNLFKNVYPYYLWLALSIYLLFVLYFILHNKNMNRRKLTLRINGIILLLLCVFELLSIFLKLSSGKLYFYMTSMTYLYPLDMIIMVSIYLAISIVFIIFSFKQTKLYFNESKKLHIPVLHDFLTGLYILVLLFFVGDLLCIYKTFDRNKNLLGVLPVYILILLMVVNVFVYEFVYRRKNHVRGSIYYACFQVMISIICIYWVGIYEKYHPNFMTESLTALFPLDHMLMESRAFSMYFLSIMNIVPSLFAIITLFMRKKKDKKVTY